MFYFIQREGRILALTVRRVAHTVAHGGAYWRILWEREQSGELGPSLAPAEPEGGLAEPQPGYAKDPSGAIVI